MRNFVSLADVEDQLRFTGRALLRLRQSFKLEKEDALGRGTSALTDLRERSRNYYQPCAERMINELRHLHYTASRVADVPSTIFLDIQELENKVKEALAHFSGTPNRLLRSDGQNTGEH